MKRVLTPTSKIVFLALSSPGPLLPPPTNWTSFLPSDSLPSGTFTFMKDQDNSASQSGHLLLLVHSPKKVVYVNTWLHKTSEESSSKRYF